MCLIFSALSFRSIGTFKIQENLLQWILTKCGQSEGKPAGVVQGPRAVDEDLTIPRPAGQLQEVEHGGVLRRGWPTGAVAIGWVILSDTVAQGENQRMHPLMHPSFFWSQLLPIDWPHSEARGAESPWDDGIKDSLLELGLVICWSRCRMRVQKSEKAALTGQSETCLPASKMVLKEGAHRAVCVDHSWASLGGPGVAAGQQSGRKSWTEQRGVWMAWNLKSICTCLCYTHNTSREWLMCFSFQILNIFVSWTTWTWPHPGKKIMGNPIPRSAKSAQHNSTQSISHQQDIHLDGVSSHIHSPRENVSKSCFCLTWSN